MYVNGGNASTFTELIGTSRHDTDLLKTNANVNLGDGAGYSIDPINHGLLNTA